ncbi:MAG: YybH family protein [Gemmatimonadales bacterium]
MSPRRVLVTAVLSFALVACAPRGEQTGMAPAAVDTAAMVAAANDVWQRWIAADTTGNVAALLELVTDSVRMDFRGMPPVIGKEAWRQAAENAFKAAKYPSITITPDMTVPVSDSLIYQNGSYSETIVMGNNTTMDYGRYATAIRRGADGQWRIAYLIGFSDSTVPVRK